MLSTPGSTSAIKSPELIISRTERNQREKTTKLKSANDEIKNGENYRLYRSRYS